MSLLYVSEFTGEFDVDVTINLENETVGSIAAGSANLHWINSKKLKISTNNQIPLGFTSLKI